MDQKSYEQTQRPKPRKKRTLRNKHLREAETTAIKKNRGQVKINKRMLELENENKELKAYIKICEKTIQKLAPKVFPREYNKL